MNKKEASKRMDAMGEIIRQNTLEEYNYIDIAFEYQHEHLESRHIYDIWPGNWDKLKKLMNYDEPKT